MVLYEDTLLNQSILFSKYIMYGDVMVAGGPYSIFKHTAGMTVLIPSTMTSHSALLGLWDGNPRMDVSPKRLVMRNCFFFVKRSVEQTVKFLVIWYIHVTVTVMEYESYPLFLCGVESCHNKI